MKIGDLAKRAGCTVETIRYYEREGLLPKPERGANNYRLYDSSHLRALCFIRNCRAFEMTLEEIKILMNLKLDPGKDCSEVNRILEEHIDHVTSRISMLEGLKDQLTSLRNLCHRIKPRKECAILLELDGPLGNDSATRNDAATHVHGTHCSHTTGTT
ncbi:Cd(II)/Pb(II)-responsive transcriptional regulator [Fundidesulfovibrio putealis]|uniref:Cd(II)/Pb(II)-responsive transcriptional regulator n=1 Tax=Fundidesulfovibrio putealis TaxID=270496 RepID=UPI0003F95C6A|nr:Cd(II)/Pb(II)-responsive transcriptional regulator [Fundidesulfovibrio putealis]